ncbi:MAG: ATP-binding cassette domain-containing protein [Bacteroidia bacterium]|jgi:Cu-processing system ATP-binding protein|nr:ATP-binding cassette domain-containing protein [Bacteroidia bacterium]MCC6768584.1 ATP-binding cassette domain-containing protein [Bacteroidia bacterium]
MIRFEQVNKHFGKLHALRNVSLNCEAGQCIALVGPNGCGKTTLFKSILGLVVPDSGDISFDGSTLIRSHLYRSRIGYMPQIGRYPSNLSIGQLIYLIRQLREEETQADLELLEEYHLESMFEKPMRSLSGGTIQKVSATIAFMFNPSVLILDEPTAGLDPLASEILKEKIKKELAKGKLIIISSHLLNELDELATQVIYMQEGEIKYHRDITELKEITGETMLSKAVVRMLKQASYV